MMLQAQSGNRLVFIGLGLAGNSTARAQLDRLAQVSGGRLVLASDPSVLPQVLSTVVIPVPQPATPPGILIPRPAEGPGTALVGLVTVNLVLLVLILLLRLRR